MSSSPSSSSPSVEEAEEAAAAQCPSSGFIATAPAAAAPPSNSPVPSAAPPPPPSRPSCYRIEHRADAAGKRIASSKRRILFHFGTLCPRTNRPSDDGVHLVTLSWSPTSGRTVLAADGREVSLRDGRRMIFGGLQVRRFEESWILGEEGGVTSSNDYGMHLRIVARAVAPPSSSSPKRTGRAQQQQQRRRRRRRGGERQFDLFIDGRSYFDLPYLDEATGRLVYGGDLSAEDENESARGGLGLLGLGLGAVSSVSSSAEMEDDANATIEDWTADGSAISGYGDDDDDDNSIDGFMQSIDLGTLTPYGDDDEKSAASSSIATVAGGTRRRGGRRRRDKIVRARNELREKSARAVGRIGTSTKTAVAQTSQRLAAGTSRVLASPKALKNRGSPSGSEGESGGEGKTNGNGGDGDGNKSARNGSSSGGGGEEGRSDYSGETSNTADSKIEEHGQQQQQQQRIAPGEYTSFQAMHRAITPPRPQREQREQEPGTPQRSRGQRQEQQQQQQKHEQTQKEAEDAAEEVIAGLRNRISRLEMEIATSDRRAAASTAKLREEAASLWETTERELSSARAQAREQRSRAEAAERECDSLRRDRDDAEEEIGRLRRHVENLERELVSATRAANDDDGTSKKKKKKKKKKEGSSREKNGPPFLPNEETMSYLGEPVCCLCNKDVTESMRQCQCGRESCDLSAHASCLIGSRHHPTPSISHPGTPAPTLPLILCRGIFDNK